MKKLVILAAALAQLSFAAAQTAPRARDLGVPFDGTPGPLNAITDVEGVTVGHKTIIKDLRGGHAVRTGVTAILPRGEKTLDKDVFAGVFSLNGNGEMTGAHWIEESGFLEGPVMITNTHSVGAVHEGVIKWRIKQAGPDASGYWWSLPVVAETWDGDLNDINGFHVKEKHVAAALDKAKAGPVAEGNVGGGTGMICHEFKCGIGTSSRRAGGYTIGVLVQANYGMRDPLRIAGVPVGQHLRNDRIFSEDDPTAAESGSIIIVIATDAPLLPQQLKRIAKRAALGLGRMGSYAGNGSGDIFIAFSTAEMDKGDGALWRLSRLDNGALDPLFLATANATEEAVVNAMVAARDMTGNEGHYAKAIDHEALRAVLKQYGRLAE
ncbi:P1 family peptidase [Hyphococcus sp.]|uniref:DmpA family aminopeptidase n=1 Tax=Hyphococcus sp. TaxID=2038636 RepID=UPI003D0AD6AA